MATLTKHKWAQIVQLLNPDGCYKHSCLSMSIFGFNALIMGCCTILKPEFMANILELNVSNTSKILLQINGIAAFNVGSYYLYMSYHRIIKCFKVTIPFHILVTFPILSYLSFKYSNKRLLMVGHWVLFGALHTLFALRYDEYKYNQLLENPLIQNINNMHYDYKLEIKVKNSNSKQKYVEYFMNASNLLSNPLMTHIDYKDITSSMNESDATNNKKYLYLNMNDNINKYNLKYNAILEFDENKFEIIAYSYAWPETYVINFYQFQNDKNKLYFVQKTYIKTIFGLKSFAVKTAKDAHTTSLNAMNQQIEGTIGREV